MKKKFFYCFLSKNTPKKTSFSRSSSSGRSENMGMRVVTDELLREKVLLRNLESSKVTEILGLPRSGGALTPPRSGGTLTPPESRGEGPPVPPRRNSKISGGTLTPPDPSPPRGRKNSKSLRVRNRSRSPSFFKNYKSVDTDPNSKWVTVQESQKAGTLR